MLESLSVGCAIGGEDGCPGNTHQRLLDAAAWLPRGPHANAASVSMWLEERASYWIWLLEGGIRRCESGGADSCTRERGRLRSMSWKRLALDMVLR